MREVEVKNLADLTEEAKRLLGELQPLQNHATLITLSGELGAGKTAFTKEVAKAFGITTVVNSPTFVIEKVYEIPTNKNFTTLTHIDAYRLKKGSELETLGFKKMMQDEKNIVLLEWPEQVSDLNLVPTLDIKIRVNDDGSRTFTYGKA